MWMLITLLPGLVKGNILGNGDFETGGLSPWTCVASQCHVTEGVLGITKSLVWISGHHYIICRCQ